ncbi:MAG: DUF4350 domain-containing protein, partial [Steroidobacteraceae bacterium]
MKERLVVLALALGALGLAAALILPRRSARPRSASVPLSNASQPDGYLAVWRWLHAEHIPTLSLRYRYDRLPALLAKPSGNLLLVTFPQRVPARRAELADLEQWVARGNTLLVMAALDDDPPWSRGVDPLLAQHLFEMTGLRLTPQSGARSTPRRPARSPGSPPDPAGTPATSAPSPSARRLELEPLGAHPLLTGVSRITALSSRPGRRWQRIDTPGPLPLQLAARAHDGAPALWVVQRGAGQIILCAAASTLSNAAIALGGNARLLANILSWSLGPGGAVVFDDAHQGETAFYDAQAFFGDPRLHATLGWIVLLWLAFVLGPLPLRAARHAWQPPGETAYVEASARYLAAVVPPGEAAPRLIERFLEELARRHNLRSQAHIWDWLDT